MPREQQVAWPLNRLRDLKIFLLVQQGLIEDYFCDRDEASEESDLSSSDESEQEADAPPLSSLIAINIDR